MRLVTPSNKMTPTQLGLMLLKEIGADSSADKLVSVRVRHIRQIAEGLIECGQEIERLQNQLTAGLLLGTHDALTPEQQRKVFG